MMFKSGSAVLKRGYVWNETAMAATMYNLRMNNAAARLDYHQRFQRGGADCGAAWACTRESEKGCVRPYVGAKSQKRTSGRQVGMPRKIKHTTRPMVSRQRFTSDLKQSIPVCDRVASR